MVSTDVETGNVIDPSGGWGKGFGCAMAAGMSGYGGTAGAVNSSLNIGRAISTVVSISTLVLNGASAVNSMAHNRTVQSAASNKSSLVDAGSVVGEEGGGGGSGGCPDCPKGYGPNPRPGGDSRP